jgi:hypothetical protein
VRGSLLQAKKDKRGLKKGEHTWNIVLYRGVGADGKPKYKWHRFHGTKQQAERKQNELVGEVQRGEYVEPTKLTVGE